MHGTGKMTSGTLYRVMAQNVTLSDIDTFRMKHHVHRRCFQQRLEILFPTPSMIEKYSRECTVVEKQAKQNSCKICKFHYFSDSILEAKIYI